MTTAQREDLVAFLFHVPGLALLSRRRPPPFIALPNALAIGATLGACCVVWVLAPPGVKVVSTALVFGVGHVAWGVYLVGALRRERRAATA